MKDSMQLHRVVVAMALIAVAACRESDDTDPPVAQASLVPPSPRQLATSWSGGQDQPRCQSRGPRGEVLALPGARYCVWEPSQGSQARGTVSGQVNAAGEPTILTWEVRTESAAEADEIVDSLGTALRAHGLESRHCIGRVVPAGQLEMTLWEAPTLLVHISRITPSSGAPRLGIVAVDDARAMPAVACG